MICQYVFLLVQISIIQGPKVGGFIHHYSVETFDVEVHVEYNTVCSSKNNFTQLVSVPRGSSILNVLERANALYPTFNGFKVLYVANSSYHLISLNNDTDTSTCHWTLSTDPATIDATNGRQEGFPAGGARAYGGILSTPLNGLFVSNIGMMVNLTYQLVRSAQSTKAKSTSSNTKHRLKENIVLTADTMWMTVQYRVVHVIEECPSAAGSLISQSAITVTIPCGSTALTVMERAANIEPAHHFIVQNIFGKYYIIDSISGITSSSSCRWCAYFTPPSSYLSYTSTPTYLLTADINNFIIPLSGGALTMKYQSSCVSKKGLAQGYMYFISPVTPYYYGGLFSTFGQAFLKEYCHHVTVDPSNTPNKTPKRKEKGATGNV